MAARSSTLLGVGGSRWKLLALVLVAGLFVLALLWWAFMGRFGGMMATTSSAGFTESPGMVSAISTESFGSQMVRSSDGINAVADLSGVAAADRSIIRTGALTLRVGSVEEALPAIAKITADLKGTVSNSEMSRVGDGSYQGSVQARVPADQFEAAIGQFKGLADYVEQEWSNADDVTEAVADLKTRLDNKRAEEAQYREILSRATAIADVLTATQYLSQVRYEIESMEAQQKNYDRQIQYSTITVSLTEDPKVAAVSEAWVPSRTVQNALREWVAFLQSGVDAVIYVAIFAWPLAVLGLLVWFWKRRK